MTTYNRTSPTDGSAATASYLDGELQKIESAVNDIDDTNIADGAIGNAKLAKPKSYFTLQLHKESVGSSIPITQELDAVVVPVDATLVSVKFICVGLTNTPSVDIYDSTGSILTSSLILSSALTVYTGGVSTSIFSAGDYLTLRALTDASEDITHVTAVLTFKANHTV